MVWPTLGSGWFAPLPDNQMTYCAWLKLPGGVIKFYNALRTSLEYHTLDPEKHSPFNASTLVPFLPLGGALLLKWVSLHVCFGPELRLKSD